MSKKYRIALFVLILLVLSISVSAIGITPGRKTIHFEPKEVHSMELTILNTENREFEAAIYVKGELSNYITLSESNVKFKRGEEKKTISYKVNLPESFEKPGLHSAEIVVGETIPEGKGETVISTIVAVASQLHVMVPYPGKYAEAYFYTKGNDDGSLNLYVRVANLGQEDIQEANAVITVFNKYDGSEIIELKTDAQLVEAKSRKVLGVLVEEALDPGEYHALAVVTYDGNKIRLESDFIVTGSLLRPIYISVKDFELGEIAKFDTLVENVGNRRLSGVYSRISIDDESGNSISDMTSNSIDIDPKRRAELNSYWGTAGVKEGTYDGKLILGYENRTDEKDIRTKVKKNSIETEILGITGFAIAETPGVVTKKTPWLAILVVLLLVINIGWLIHVKKKK